MSWFTWTFVYHVSVLYGWWVIFQWLILNRLANYLAWRKVRVIESLPWNWRVLVSPERYFDWLTKQIVEGNDLDDWLDQIRKSE